MFDGLKKKLANAWFKNNTEDVPEVPKYPFDIMLGSKLTLKSRTQRIYKSLCEPARDVQVTSIGTFKHAEATVTRIYFDNDMYLQVITAAGDMSDILECRLFMLSAFHQPSTKDGWDEWINGPKYKIGNITFDHQDREFLRLESWADGEPERVPGVCFRENVVAQTTPEEYYIEHEAMAYGRWLNEEHGIAEYLQVSAMEWYNPIGSMFNTGVAIDVGIDILPSEIEVAY